MSKMDDLRAMREARYERMTARADKPKTSAPKAKFPAPEVVKTEQVPNRAETMETQPCGHRAISGRTCTREQGHTERSHRYS